MDKFEELTNDGTCIFENRFPNSLLSLCRPFASICTHRTFYLFGALQFIIIIIASSQLSVKYRKLFRSLIWWKERKKATAKYLSNVMNKVAWKKERVTLTRNPNEWYERVWICGFSIIPNQGNFERHWDEKIWIKWFTVFSMSFFLTLALSLLLDTFTSLNSLSPISAAKNTKRFHNDMPMLVYFRVV